MKMIVIATLMFLLVIVGWILPMPILIMFILNFLITFPH